MRQFLAAVRGRLVVRSWLLSALVLADLLLLLVLVGLTPRLLAFAATRIAYLLFAGLTLTLALATIARRLRRWPRDRDVARLVARSEPSVSDSLLTAVELETGTGGPHLGSQVLVALHRDDTARRIAELHPARLVPWSPLVPLARLGAALGVTVILITWVQPGILTRFFRALWLPPAGASVFAAGGAISGATIGQLRLTYHYPLYSGLEPRVVEGATGDIRALRGSEVVIEAIADAPIAAAWIRLDSGGTIAFELSGDRRVHTRLTVSESGRWHTELEDPSGGVSVDALTHAITVDEDTFPEVHLEAPAADLELDDRDELEIRWRATDDFGLGEAHLVIARMGSETRTRLELKPGAREQAGTVSSRELKLAFAPGDDLGLYVEVIDNDTVSGPKRSVSETRRVRVRSAEEAHSELLTALSGLLDELVTTLAIPLPAPPPQPLNTGESAALEQAIGTRLSLHVSALDEILRGLWSDPLGSETTYERVAEMRVRLEALAAENASFLTRAAPALRRPIGDAAVIGDLLRIRSQEIQELETDVLVLDDLVHRERVEELKRLAESLLRDQERLSAMLEEYARTGDAAAKAEIDRLVQRMEHSLQALEARMAELGDGAAPDEFLNLDRLRQAMGKSAAESLAAMKAGVESGDAEAASARARELTASLRGALAMLEKGVRPGASAASDTRLFDEANRLAERLAALVEAEGKLIDSTDHVKRQVDSRRFAEHGQPGDIFARDRERAAEIARLLREAQSVIDGDPAFAERRRIAQELEQAGADGRRRMFEGAPIAELERRQREIFDLRAKLTGLGGGDVLAARDALERSASFADAAAMALAGRSLSEAQAAVQELTMMAGEADGRLSASSSREPVGAASAATSPDASAEGTELRARAGATAGRAFREATELQKDLRALDSLLRRPASADASAVEAKSLREFARRQRSLETEAQEIDALAEKLADEMPNLPPDLRDSLGQAADYMNIAAGALGEQDVTTGLHNEREAKARLEQAARAAGQAAGSCQSGGGAGAKPGGSQLAFIPQGVGGEPRFRRQGGGNGENRLGGSRGFAADKVAIPDAGDARAPEAFREELLEAMKEPRPDGYRERIDLYYRRLVQ